MGMGFHDGDGKWWKWTGKRSVLIGAASFGVNNFVSGLPEIEEKVGSSTSMPSRRAAPTPLPHDARSTETGDARDNLGVRLMTLYTDSAVSLTESGSRESPAAP